MVAKPQYGQSFNASLILQTLQPGVALAEVRPAHKTTTPEVPATEEGTEATAGNSEGETALSSSASPSSSMATADAMDSTLDQDMAKCTLASNDPVPDQEQNPKTVTASPQCVQRKQVPQSFKSRPPNLPYPSPQPAPTGLLYPPQNYYIAYQCTT